MSTTTAAVRKITAYSRRKRMHQRPCLGATAYEDGLVALSPGREGTFA